MKKFTFIAAFFALLLGNTSPVAAQDCGSNWGDCCEWSMCDGKFKVGAEWLYWQTSQDNMAYVLTSDVALDVNGERNFFEHNPKFEYESGFRVGLGYELPCNCWEVDVVYTYVPAKLKKKSLTSDSATAISSIPGVGLVALINFDDGREILTFDQSWDLPLNNVDVDFARTITFNECVSIRPHVGFRTLWYKEKQRVFATVTTEPSPTEDDFNNYYALATNKFNGYGVEGGLWAGYQLGCGLSLIGHFGGSILYTKYKLTDRLATTLVSGDVTTAVNTLNGSTCIKTATPTLDYFLGIMYADQMCDMSFAIRAGWEQHVLFNTNRIFGNGNLSTQGLTLGLEVGF